MMGIILFSKSPGTVDFTNPSYTHATLLTEGTEETPSVLTVGANVRITSTEASNIVKSIEATHGKIIHYGTIDSEQGTVRLNVETENRGTIQSQGGTLVINTTIDNADNTICVLDGSIVFTDIGVILKSCV